MKKKRSNYITSTNFSKAEKLKKEIRIGCTLASVECTTGCNFTLGYCSFNYNGVELVFTAIFFELDTLYHCVHHPVI